MSSPLTLAVLADVHGNGPALAACLDFAKRRGIEHYLFLGDYITDHAYPQRVLSLLREMDARYDCLFIRGNREEYMIDYRQNGGRESSGTVWQNTTAQGALLYCYENLTDEDISWFERMPVFDIWETPGAPAVACCHGSPEKAKAHMSGGPGSLELLAKISPELLVKGHNHRHFSLWHRGKRIICAGSVGNPIWRRTRPGPFVVTCLAKTAQMTLLHLQEGRWIPEYICLPYDWQETLENLETSGLTNRAPVWAALLRHNVLTGCDPFGVVAERATALYRKESGLTVSWAEIPEAFWECAANEYHVALY